MEGLGGEGKILGMPRKVAIPVLGVAVIAVVYVVIRSRSSQGSTAGTAPQDAGAGYTGGGGGGGGYVGGYADAPPVNPLQEKLDRLYFEKEQFGYNIDQRKENERQANWEIQHTEEQSSLGTYLQLLPFQLETQKAHEGAQQAAYGADVARYSEEASFANRGAATQNQVTNLINAGKLKPECGKGQSSYLDPNTGEWRCKQAGTSGIKTAENAIGNTILQAGQAWLNQYLAPPALPGKKNSNRPAAAPAPSGGYQEGGVGY